MGAEYFCATAFGRRLRIPVTHMPYAVEAPAPPVLGREALGLPRDAFVFLFVFDAFSVPARKNPDAVVEAYARLRGRTSRSTHLVLKVINAESAPGLLDGLRAAAAAEPTISIVDRYMRRPELNALMHAADAYVSLHRSEGFGLTLAEAMALGKPVVATGWSGNMDFMTPWNSCPVDYRLVTLDTDHGPYPRGQSWADPDTGRTPPTRWRGWSTTRPMRPPSAPAPRSTSASTSPRPSSGASSAPGSRPCRPSGRGDQGRVEPAGRSSRSRASAVRTAPAARRCGS